MYSDFLDYFNEFYGLKGIYPIKNICPNEIIKAIGILYDTRPNYSFEGDSLDRELIRDIVFTDSELKKAYSKQ